jgi:hypothetical protein
LRSSLPLKNLKSIAQEVLFFACKRLYIITLESDLDISLEFEEKFNIDSARLEESASIFIQSQQKTMIFLGEILENFQIILLLKLKKRKRKEESQNP